MRQLAAHPRTRAAYAAAGLALTAAYASGALPAWAGAAIAVAMTAVGAAALLASVRLHRPADRTPWLLLGGMAALWTVGWSCWEARFLRTGAPPAPSSLLNLLFLAGYPLLILALLRLLRRREPGPTALLDATMVAIALGVVAWVVLVSDFIADSSLPVFGRVVQIMYAVFDVVSIAVVIRILFAPGRRSPALLLLVGATLANLFSDGIWNWSTKLNSYVPGSWADSGWLLLPLLLGLAALEPSMRDLYEPVAPAARRLRWDRLALLLAASVVTPVVFAVEGPAVGTFVDSAGIALGAIGISVLVIARLALVLREQGTLAASLERQNRRLRDAEEISHFGSWEWDTVAGRSFWSREVYRIAGVPETFAPTRENALVLMHPDDRERSRATFARALATGESFDYQYRLVRPDDGAIRHIRSRGGPAPGEDGRRMLVGTIVDETDQHEAHARLRELASIVESTGDAAIAATLEGIVTAWNPGAERLFGYTAAEMIGEPVARLAPESLRGEQMHWLEVLRRDGYATFDTRRVAKDGREVHVSMALSPLRDENGQVTGLSSIMRDIGDRRRLEADREEAARALAEQNERLRDLDSLKDSFVASVSHELRTPLTSIRGYLDLVLEGEAGDLTDEQRQFLGVVARNSERLLRLVGDLLFVAQVDAGKLELELGPVDLLELVEESVQSARPHAEAKQIELVLEAEPVPTLDADRARLAQLLDNLLSNAIKFTPPGGRAAVTVRERNGTVLLEVADTGMGIPAAEQEHLFERFFRAKGATEQAIQGTGLGLSIALAIAEAHGGSIGVQSTEGNGTTFRIELPLEQRIHPPAKQEVLA